MADYKRYKKNKQIIINAEEPIAEAFAALANRESTSISDYGRRLIIRDLISRGLLPEATIERLLTGAGEL